jgi:hypothetical protein
MRVLFRTIALAVVAWLAAAPVARAEVHLSLRNGRVTIVAKDATIRQILAEWARVGNTTIVNAERIPGAPLTLEIKDVPEAEALDILLRSLSGYIAAPRATMAGADTSVYASIAVMPTIASAAPRNAAPSAAPAPFSPPAFTQNEDDQQDNSAVRPGVPPPQNPARPPIFSTFPAPQTGNANPNAARPTLPTVRPGTVGQPQPQNTNVNEPPPPVPASAPASQTAPSTVPGGRTGTSAPGMMPPAASQPGQIVAPPRPPGAN